jgi:hypothetical protein
MDYYKSLIFGRNDYSPKVKNILNKYGNINIVSGMIQRHPLPKLYTISANILSLGQFKRNNPYDKLFHLYVIFVLENGVRILVEKNEVINMEINPLPHPDTEKMFLNVKHTNLNKIMENTKNKMGSKFFYYNASNNNCQVFILNLLEANFLENPYNKEFVKQDTEHIFRNTPRLKLLTNTITNIGSRVDVLKQGGKTKCKRCDNGTSGIQLENALKNVKDFNGVYTKDKIPHLKKEGWYILNMEDEKDGDGTHWVAWKYTPHKCSYSDSFGVIPPLDVLQNSNEIIYTTKQLQDIKSSCCGWFAVACILCDNPMLKPEQSLLRYESRFSSNTAVNDYILNNILNFYGIKNKIHL